MSSEIDKDTLEKYLFDETLPEEEITKRQWQIIDAAVKIFSEKGFEGSRTSDIAKEADIAEGTIFRYYKTKKDILMGLLLPMITKFFRPLILSSVEKIIENSEDKTLEDVIYDTFCDRLALAKKNLSLVKTIMIESAFHPELLKPIQNEIVPKIVPFIDKMIEKNIEKGELRKLEPRLISRTLMSSLIGYIILTSAFPETFRGEEDEKEMRKLADIMINGIKNPQN